MERWGHDESRGTHVVRRDDLAVGGRIPFQEPCQGLGLDVDGCRAFRPSQDGPHPPIRAQDRVGPVPPLDPVRTDPQDDGRMPFLDSLRPERIRLRPAHNVAGLISMEMKGKGGHRSSRFEGPRFEIQVGERRIARFDRRQPG